MPRWSKVTLVVVAGLLLAYGFLALTASPRPPHPFVTSLPAERPLVVAHQGGNHLFPDNTLYAFERSRALGADVLEMDVHASADGVVVVIHDDTVDRTTDGRGAVRDMTFADLQALDAAYRWSPLGAPGTTPYRGEGLRIPSLEEVLARFEGVHLNVEIKQLEPSISAEVCRLIREYGATERVLVASFHDAVLREFRRACPEVATSLGPNEVRVLYALNMLFLGELYRPAAEAVQVPERFGNLRVVTERFIRSAQRKNMQVHVWTVNDEADMRRLSALGIDALITDRPDLALTLR